MPFTGTAKQKKETRHSGETDNLLKIKQLLNMKQ